MATSFGVLYNGKRHAVKLTPMQHLTKIVEQVSELAKQQLDSSNCKIYYNKKELDLSTPARFANLPSGATLELKTGQEKVLGIQERTAPAPVATVPPEAAPSQAQLPESEGTPAPSTSAAPSAQGFQAPQAASTAEAGPSTAGTTASAQEAPGRSDPLSLGRSIHVFSRAAAAEQEASRRAGEQEPPEEFFEFTADDFQRVVAGQARERARAESGLRTQKLRDEEIRRRAAALGPVPIRVHFPNDIVLQASFSALEQLSALRDLIQKCLLPSIARGNWQIYTTPPKQVIKDFSASFYSAALVPAANVHVSLGDGASQKGQYLRPEVMALQGTPPEARGLAHKQQQNQSQGTAPDLSAPARTTAAVAGSSGSSRASATGTDGKKLPKWLKMTAK